MMWVILIVIVGLFIGSSLNRVIKKITRLHLETSGGAVSGARVCA